MDKFKSEHSVYTDIAPIVFLYTNRTEDNIDCLVVIKIKYAISAIERHLYDKTINECLISRCNSIGPLFESDCIHDV